MNEEAEVIIHEIKPLNPGFRWTDEDETAPAQTKDESANPTKKKVLLIIAIIALMVILLMPDSNSQSGKSFVETFSDKSVLGKKYNSKVITQIDVVTRAEAAGNKKITLTEIDKLMSLVKEDLLVKGKSVQDINFDDLYSFCLQKRSKYK